MAKLIQSDLSIKDTRIEEVVTVNNYMLLTKPADRLLAKIALSQKVEMKMFAWDFNGRKGYSLSALSIELLDQAIS